MFRAMGGVRAINRSAWAPLNFASRQSTSVMCLSSCIWMPPHVRAKDWRIDRAASSTSRSW